MAYKNEMYQCFTCDKSFVDSEVLEQNSWRCPDCNEPIYIAAPNLGAGYVMIRKLASELKINDPVDISHKGEFNSVLSIKEVDGGYRVALKGYTSRFFGDNQFVNVADHRYSEENWRRPEEKPQLFTVLSDQE